MKLNLTVDRLIKGRIYPSLTTHDARPYTQSWREFGQHWPYTVPLRLQEYFEYHGVEITFDDPTNILYYPIGLAFFDFSIDYIAALPEHIYQKLKNKKIKLLFYYHEGDNPVKIKDRLDNLIDCHRLHENSYIFISANSAADSLPGFIYFNDFELWYYHRNLPTKATKIINQIKPYDFTVLNRLHKSWRATIMADLNRNSLLENSLWSYCSTGSIESDNPIELDSIDNLRQDTERFIKSAPYYSDSLSQDQRNDHSNIGDIRYHRDSYCNIVLETHFDADQSGGVFITEKTFKPLKHGQLFFIAGCAGSLSVLRTLGYSTFDNYIDTTYDTIVNNTERWNALLKSIKESKPVLHKIYTSVIKEITNNQQLFLEIKTQRLTSLLEKIYDKSS